jgi:hypothetical protein
MQTKGHLNLLELNTQKAIIAYVDARLAELGLDDADTRIAAIAAWGTELATKLNADAGVTDANYDTTPLA